MTQTELLQVIAGASIKCALILGAAGIVTTLASRASAAFRHLVWTVAVVSSLAIPLLGSVLPQWNADVTGLIAVAQKAMREIPVAAAPIGAEAMSAATTNPQALTIVGDAIAQSGKSVVAADGNIVERQPQSSLAPIAPRSQPDNVISSATAETATPALRDWTSILFVLWALGVVAALLPTAFGIIRLRTIARTARQVRDGRWAELVERIRHASHLPGRVNVVESESTTMPMTWGIFTPTLLVPARSSEWTEWQCRNVLMHELAHVERRDCLTQMLAQVLCAIHWFNPLAWYASHRMRVERELACDDRVLTTGSAPSDYAANLLDVARSLRAPSYTSQTAIAMARPSQLSGRLLAVLDGSRNRSTVNRSLATVILIAAGAIVLPLASLTPAQAIAEERKATSEVPTETGNPTVSAPSPAGIVRAIHVPNVNLTLPPAPETEEARPAPGVTVASIGSALSASVSSSAAMRSLGSPAPLKLLLPLIENCWEGSGKSSSNISINDDGKDGRRPSWNVRYSRDDCSLELRAEGRFTLRADLSDVESLDRDGWIRVEEREGRNSRRVEIRNVGSGLEHTYYINGDRRAFDNDGRAWLARTLLAVERRTAFAASTRVPQLYRTGGVRAVSNEISQMQSAYPKASYYKTMLDMGIQLDANTLNTIVNAAANELSSSDYYLTEVLGKLVAQPRANQSTWKAFADATTRMKSDYYKASAINKILKNTRVDNETVRSLLKSSTGIKSDYYLAEVLKSVAKDYAINEDTRPYYVEALRNISSDYYRRQVLTTMNGSGEWDSRTTSVVLASIGEIKSDYEKSQSLISLAKAGRIDNWAAYFSAATNMESSYYQRQTLEAALKIRPLTRDIVAGVLSVAPRLKSDSDLAGLLGTVAKNYRIEGSLRAAYEKASDEISSDYYRGAALVALRKSMDTQ
ncbi:MAG TPA: M56 family metallopeptidase [Gemmatimonadaceae bacterium]|nr:M56 family metallopeptidase [Gemmatimonadaceae bacterium]